MPRSTRLDSSRTQTWLASQTSGTVASGEFTLISPISCAKRSGIVLILSVVLGIPAANGEKRADLSTLIAVGDSLLAGVQNIALEGSLQQNGLGALIARQAGVPFVLPLVHFPGAPPALRLIQNGPIPVIGPVAPPQPVGRLNPTQRPNNLAVPSFTVANALEYRPNATVTPAPGDRGPLVLGFPGPFLSPGPAACASNPMPECIGQTMIEQAKARRPTTTLIWIGNNDALIAALFGNTGLLTPVAKFQADFSRLLGELESTGSTLVVATIPDVTAIPYFSAVRDIAAQYSMPVQTVAGKLGVGADDFVRRSALTPIDDILRNRVSGPLPVTCGPPIYVLPPVPCRMTAAEATAIGDRVETFNRIIARETENRDGLLVDTNKLVSKIARKGYRVGREKLTTRFLGGLFSLDGIHPTNTGYAVIANYFIQKMNDEFGLRVRKVDIDAVWAADPLRPFASTLSSDRDDDDDDDEDDDDD